MLLMFFSLSHCCSTQDLKKTIIKFIEDNENKSYLNFI
jgi:hypothetical protein